MKKTVLFFACLFLSLVVWSQVSGVVMDADGEPLVGVSVLQEGTKTGTITDIDGHFSLDVPIGAKLQFSYMGYKTHTTKAAAAMKIHLLEDTQLIEEVVVVGYGTQRKSDLTGSVASVSAEDLNATPTSSVAEMLRGQAAGVVVTENSMRPGGSSDIVIRGKKSINGGNAPLYIVDGAPVDNIDDLNAQDIQSLEILKDASSQSIYGARASNGVILITTKSGQAGKTQVDLNAYAGAQTLKRNFDFYNGDEWAQLKREANRSFNYDPATGTYSGSYMDDESLFGNMYSNLLNRNYTDWESLMIHPAVQQKYDLSVRSGKEKSKIAASLGFYDQQGMIAPAAYRRYNGSFNSQFQLHKRVSLGFSFKYAHTRGTQEDGNIANILAESPLLSAFDEEGKMLNMLADGKWSPLWNNQNYINETKTNRILTNVTVDWNIWGGLKYHLNANMNLRFREQGIYQNRQHEKGSAMGGIASITNTAYEDYLLENVLTYEHNWEDKHKLDVTFVQSINAIKTTKNVMSGSGFSSDNLGYNSIASASITNPSERTITPRRLVSFMGRVRYNLMDKYLFSLSARVDGSSVFGKNNKWGCFPAGSFAWRINQEDWLVDVQWLTNLKIRASYGLVGNQAISPYQTQGVVDGYYFKFGDNDAIVGYLPGTQLQNPNLKWETTGSLNIGIDFGFLQDRIMGTIEYYHSTTRDLLMLASINQTSGYTSQLRNVGSVLNQGVEVTLGFVPVKRKKITWDINITLSHNKNTILALNGDVDENGKPVDDLTNKWFIGHSIDAYYDYQFDGIYQLGDADINPDHSSYPQPGDIRVKDVNGDGQITPDDRVIIERAPLLTGSLSTSLNCYGVDLSLDFYGVYGAIKQNAYLYSANQGGDLHGNRNGMKVNYWTLENPSTTAPRPRDGTIDYFSSLSYQDASYLRLRTLTVGYTFPKKWMEKAHISKLRLYFTASNVFTATKFLSYSPELSAGSYPEPRTFVGGINLSFN